MDLSSVRLVIETVGEREAIASLESLDRAGRRIVESVSGATGRALGDVASAYRRAGDIGQDAFRSVAVRADMAAESTRRLALVTKESTKSHESAGLAAGMHGLQLGRLRMELGTLLGRLSGTNTALDRMGGAIASMAVGDPMIIGVLAGLAALAAGYKFLTKDAHDAAKALDDVREAAAKAANAGKADDLQEMARQLTFGSPFSADGKKLMANSDRVKGAFSGSIADLQAQRRELDQLIANAPNALVASHFANQEKKLDKMLNPMLERLAAVKRASENLASQPSDGAGHLQGVNVSAMSDDAIAKQAAAARKKMAHEAILAAKQLHKLNIENVKAEMELEVVASAKKIKLKADQAAGIQKSIISMQGSLKATFDAAHIDVNADITALAQQLERDVAKTLGDALAKGIETAFSNRSLGDGFKALTATLLSGLGDMMIAMGTSMIGFGALVEWFSKALIALNGGNMVAAGLEMVAAGAILKAGSGAVSGSIGRSGGGSYSGGSSGGMAQIIDRGVINPGSYSSGSAAGIQSKQPITFAPTIIGPNDPNAIRGIDEILRRLNQRGSLAGATG